jgi:acylphosphatase
VGELSEGRVIVAHRLRITGRVQGVGFRWFTTDQAARLGIAGWTCNLADGSVLVEAEAERAAMELFVAALREGPPAASVTQVFVEPRAAADPLPIPFQVRR